MKAPARFIVPMVAVAIVGLAGASSDVRSADDFSLAHQEAAQASPRATPQGTTTVIHSSGGFVQTSQIDDVSSVGIYAVLASNNDVSQVLLTYSASYYDPDSQSCVQNDDLTITCSYTRTVFDLAIGPIGPTDMEISKTAARLVTDLANHPGIPLSRCVVDGVAGTFTCTDLELTGTIDLSWASTRDFERVTRGSVLTRSGPNTIKTSGAFTERSADAQGTVLGRPHVSSFGTANIGSNIGATIEILRPPR